MFHVWYLFFILEKGQGFSSKCDLIEEGAIVDDNNDNNQNDVKNGDSGIIRFILQNETEKRLINYQVGIMTWLTMHLFKLALLRSDSI